MTIKGDMYDVIIFSGQSNMVGSAGSYEEFSVKDAFEYRYITDSIEPLKNPVGENILYGMKEGYPFDEKYEDKYNREHVLGAPCCGNINLVPYFADEFTKLTSAKLVAVHAAKGGSQISDWMPETQLYKAAVKKAKACIEKVGIENINSISAVWFQGESDAMEKTPYDVYYKLLEEFAESLKKDLNVGLFGIIRVGEFASTRNPENRKYDFEIMKAQEDICKNKKDYIMLTHCANDLINNKKYENELAIGHYNAEGLKIIGREAGRALANAKKQRRIL